MMKTTLSTLVAFSLVLAAAPTGADYSTDSYGADGHEHCDELEILCKTVTIDDADGDGFVEANEEVTVTINITINNTNGNHEMRETTLFDNLPSTVTAAEDIATDADDYDFKTHRGNNDKNPKKSKSSGESLTATFSDLAAGSLDFHYIEFNVTFTVGAVGEESPINPCSWYEVNGGATLKWKENRGGNKLYRNSTGTEAHVLFIYGDDADTSDCDGDGLTDQEEIDGGTDPLVFNDADGDGVGDGHDLCPGSDTTLDGPADADGCTISQQT